MVQEGGEGDHRGQVGGSEHSDHRLHGISPFPLTVRTRSRKNPVRTCMSCMTLSKQLELPVPQFLHLCHAESMLLHEA